VPETSRESNSRKDGDSEEESPKSGDKKKKATRTNRTQRGKVKRNIGKKNVQKTLICFLIKRKKNEARI